MPAGCFAPISKAKSRFGEKSSGFSMTRPAAFELSFLLAGSSQNDVDSDSMSKASACETDAIWYLLKLCFAMLAVSSSFSIAVTSRPAWAKASASPPMPQPKSVTDLIPLFKNFWACQAETCCRVACSRPSSVKSIVPARSKPNFDTARERSFAWEMHSATS